MIEIKRDTIIGDILDVAPQTAPWDTFTVCERFEKE